MDLKYLYAGLSFTVGVALVALVASLPVWFTAFSASGIQNEAFARAIRFVGAPVALAGVGFWWGAAVVELRQTAPIALFVSGLLFATLSIPVMFLFLFLLDGASPLFFGAIAAVGSFFWAPVFNGLDKSRDAS